MQITLEKRRRGYMDYDDDRKTYGDVMWYGGLLAGFFLGILVAIIAVSVLLAYGS